MSPVRARIPRRRVVRARMGVLEDVCGSAGGQLGSKDAAATLDDLHEAVTTFEDAARTTRRVFGGAHPRTTAIEGKLQECRATGLARMPAEQRFDKATRASNPAKGLVHYLGRLKKARWRGSARKIAKFGRKVQKYNRLAVAAVEASP